MSKISPDANTNAMNRDGFDAGLVLRGPRPSSFLFAAVFIPFALLASITWLANEFNTSFVLRQQAADSYDRRVRMITLVSRIEEAETSQRGFLLTGDPQYLSRFEPAKQEALGLIRQARTFASQRDAVAAIEAIAQAKFSEMDQTIRLARAGRLPAAVRIVHDGQGRLLMDSLHRHIAKLRERDARAVASIHARSLTHRQRVQATIILIVTALWLAMLISMALMWRLRCQRHGALIEAMESAERNSIILDSTIDAIIILNPAGRIEVMNAAARAMLGYALAELAQREIGTVLETGPGLRSFHHHVGLDEGKLQRPYLADCQVRHRDGRMIPVDVAIGVMDLPSGVHLVVSLRDIAERKRIECMKDELMATVNHELRTPLTSIVGSLGLLKADASEPLGPRASRLIDIADKNAQRLIRLINDMLDFDRFRSGKLQIARRHIDLRDVVTSGCQGGEGLAAVVKVSIAFRVPAAPVFVAGDADRLLQVIANLVSNAIKAAPAGSRIVVALVDDGRGRARVTIDDAGTGVPEAFRERIFGRFERADDLGTGAGTGLGLAISREIVERHGGRLWFEDRADGGTRFAFVLDLVASLPLPADRRILIVSADRELSHRLARLVGQLNGAYELVDSCAAATAALQRRPSAAIVLDLALPDGEALAFARGLRTASPPCPIPIVTVAASAQGDGEPTQVLEACDPMNWMQDSTLRTSGPLAGKAHGTMPDLPGTIRRIIHDDAQSRAA